MAEGVSFLIARGHALKDILGYSLRQLNAFIELAAMEDRKAQASVAWCGRIAYHADGKTFTEAMKKLG